MTTILLTIIGILIAGAAALMLIWYGGDAYGHGDVEARAAAAMNNVGQVADAVALRNHATGERMVPLGGTTNIDMLLAESYLESIPRNAVTNDSGKYYFVDRTGLDRSISDTREPVFWVSQEIGSDTDADARKVCRSIEKKLSATSPEDHVDHEVHFEDWTAVHDRPACIDNFWSKKFVLMFPV